MSKINIKKNPFPKKDITSTSTMSINELSKETGEFLNQFFARGIRTHFVDKYQRRITRIIAVVIFRAKFLV